METLSYCDGRARQADKGIDVLNSNTQALEGGGDRGIRRTTDGIAAFGSRSLPIWHGCGDRKKCDRSEEDSELRGHLCLRAR